MDHPSRGFHLPSQVDGIHEQSVPYGWGRYQLAHMRFQPRSHASSGWSLGSTEKAGKGCNQPCGNPREHSAEPRRTDCPQDSESKTVCVFARIRAMNCLMKPSEARVSESVSQSRPRTSTCDSGDPGGFRSSCKCIRERPIVKQIQQILSIDQNNYTTLTSLKLGFTPIRRPGDSECLFAQVFIDLNLGVPFPTRC